MAYKANKGHTVDKKQVVNISDKSEGAAPLHITFLCNVEPARKHQFKIRGFQTTLDRRHYKSGEQEKSSTFNLTFKGLFGHTGFQEEPPLASHNVQLV